jgi:hypothetical protein
MFAGRARGHLPAMDQSGSGSTATAGIVRLLVRENAFTSLRELPRLLRHPVWRAGRRDDGAGRGVVLVRVFSPVPRVWR